MDTYTVRKRILRHVLSSRGYLRGAMLDVGSGRMPYRDVLATPNGSVSAYIGIDLFDKTGARPNYGRPHVYWDGSNIPTRSDCFDSALATEVLEHCPDPSAVLAEMFRVLKPGGHLVLTVPFLWPLHDDPFDEYRYTPYALKRLAISAGFTLVDVRALGGWDGALAQMLGLWVRRRGMRPFLRRALSILLIPVIKILDRRDDRVDFYGEGEMVTNIGAVLQKPPPGDAENATQAMHLATGT